MARFEHKPGRAIALGHRNLKWQNAAHCLCPVGNGEPTKVSEGSKELNLSYQVQGIEPGHGAQGAL